MRMLFRPYFVSPAAGDEGVLVDSVTEQRKTTNLVFVLVARWWFMLLSRCDRSEPNIMRRN